MKTGLIISQLLLCSALIVTPLNAQKQEVVISGKKAENKTIRFEMIKTLKFDGNFKVVFEQGTAGSINFTNFKEENIEMDQIEEKLIIRQKKRIKKQELKITLPNITKIESEGTFSFVTEKPVQLDNLDLNLNGVVSLDLKLVNSGTISGKSNGVSLIVLNGSAEKVNLEFNGFGMLDQDKLKAKEVNARNSSIGLLPALSELIRKIDKM